MTSIDSEYTRTFPAPDPLKVSIELGNGQVAVTAGDVSEAVVTLTPASPDDRDALELIARSRVELHGNALHIDVPRLLGFRVHPDIVIEATVPTGSTISVKSGSADVRLTGTFGETSVKTGSGDVWVDAGSTARIGTGSGDVRLGLVDAASVKSASGDVLVERSRGDVDVTTASGEIHIADLGGDGRLNSASGDVEVGASAGEVAVKTASGAVSVYARNGEVQVKTATGHAEIVVVGGTPTLLDCSSVTGAIRSELQPSEAPTDDDTERLVVRVRTVSGAIAIRRAR